MNIIKGKPIDLVLVTDEPIAWEGDYRLRNTQMMQRDMKRLGITDAEKEQVERQFGVREYFQPMKNGSNGGSEEQFHRVVVPHRPHLSLCDLATVARRHGYEVRVIDNICRFRSRWEQLEAILREKPKALGISTTFLLTPQIVRDYVEKIRSIAGDTKIILGGPTARKAEELHGYADFAVFGDGEEPLLGILDVLHGRRSPESVPYIAYKGADGATHYGPSGADAAHVGVNGKAFKARDVGIPVPDWTLAHRSFKNVFAIEFSRGCKYNCFYCSYDRGKNIRAMADLRRELIRNADLGITRYRVSDSNFTDGPPTYQEYPHDVCRQMVDLGLGLEWSCYARVDDLTDELADLMRRAGCFAVFFGIESGSDKILKNMRKGHDVADAHRGVEIARRSGILSHASFIVGYPGETQETFLQTLDFIEKARPDTVNLGQFRVEHDTPVYGVKDFELEGVGMTWKHKTMDSTTADELVAKGNERLLRNGICLGTEHGFPVFMGLGLSMGESYQLMKDMDVLSSDYRKGQDDFKLAYRRLRDHVLNRFPEAVAKDQRAWQSAT